MDNARAIELLNLASSRREALRQAKDWFLECEWADADTEYLMRLSIPEVVRGIERNYPGGWVEFLKDGYMLTNHTYDRFHEGEI